MTIAEMLGQSGVLTVLGMGVVFGFLVILVFAVTLTGKAIHGLGLDRDLQPQPAAAGAAAGSPDGAVVAAITVAVTEFRKS
jgi:oxaloacetate decarboxylase gamma subunit